MNSGSKVLNGFMRRIICGFSARYRTGGYNPL